MSLIKGIYSKAQNTAKQTDNKSHSSQTSQVQGHLSPASGCTAQLYTYTPASTQMWRLIAVFICKHLQKSPNFSALFNRELMEGYTPLCREKSVTAQAPSLTLSFVTFSFQCFNTEGDESKRNEKIKQALYTPPDI